MWSISVILRLAAPAPGDWPALSVSGLMTGVAETEMYMDT